MANTTTTSTGHSIEQLVETVKEHGDNPQAQYYYATYADVFHTSPDCPYIQNAKNLHVAGRKSQLNGPYISGANKVIMAGDNDSGVKECSWCQKHGGWHPHEHPDKPK